MKSKITIFLMTALMLLASTSCKDKDPDGVNGIEPEEDKVRVKIKSLYNGEKLNFNDVYLTQEGYRIQFTKLNLILTNFKDGDNTLFKSAVYRYENSEILHEGPGDYSKFNNLTGLLGVSEEENHSDPAARDLEDPLNIMHTGDMHWGWNTGYIFAMIEGRIDTTGTEGESLPLIWSYHTGKTFLLQDLELENISWTKVNDLMHETIWYLDAEKIFDGLHTIDIKEKRSSHTNPGEEEISENISINIKHAIRTE
jgi:hypothetical protein